MRAENALQQDLHLPIALDFFLAPRFPDAEFALAFATLSTRRVFVAQNTATFKSIQSDALLSSVMLSSPRGTLRSVEDTTLVRTVRTPLRYCSRSRVESVARSIATEIPGNATLYGFGCEMSSTSTSSAPTIMCSSVALIKTGNANFSATSRREKKVKATDHLVRRSLR